jgi:hypothetical protein
MTITKTVKIEIDLPRIIAEVGLTKNSKVSTIAEAVHDYINGLDDRESCLLTGRDEVFVITQIMEILNGQ